MEGFLWLCAVAILGLAAVAGSGRLGSMPPVVRDAPVLELREGPLRADDLRRVQFDVVVPGYSMAQVDELLERLAGQLHGATGGRASRSGVVESAIMGESEFSQPRREGDHGSNEAPHR